MGLLKRTSLVVLLAACDRPRPLVICHNANCTGDTSPSNSDTLDGLRAALALDLDGVELDFLWDAPRDRCAFAHDLETAPTREDAQVAVDELRTFAQTHPEPFTVVLDGKPSDDRARLATCLLDAAATLATVPSFAVYISSVDPALLRIISDEQALRGLALPLTAGFASPRPLGSSEPLSAFDDVPLAGISAHPRWLTDQEVAALDDAGLSLFLWSHILTTETLDTIDRYEPYAVGTDDVALLRAWIDRD
jgi:hypothetical protein